VTCRWLQIAALVLPWQMFIQYYDCLGSKEGSGCEKKAGNKRSEWNLIAFRCSRVWLFRVFMRFFNTCFYAFGRWWGCAVQCTLPCPMALSLPAWSGSLQPKSGHKPLLWVGGWFLTFLLSAGGPTGKVFTVTSMAAAELSRVVGGGIRWSTLLVFKLLFLLIFCVMLNNLSYLKY
jgi:hypothetical protein